MQNENSNETSARPTHPTYRIQCKDSDARWFTLALRDMTVTRDSEARAVVRSYTDSTGLEYRAQFQHGRRWIAVRMN